MNWQIQSVVSIYLPRRSEMFWSTTRGYHGGIYKRGDCKLPLSPLSHQFTSTSILSALLSTGC